MAARRAANDSPQVDDRPFIDATEESKSRYGRFNLAIVGNSGVGKSSLVNAVFGRDLAKVGQGLPVTKGVHYYHDEILGIWDFEGFEIGTAKSPAEILRQNLDTISQRPAIEQISVVWYCVNSHADRLLQPEIAMIQELDSAGLPVILVLTKVDWQKNPLNGKRSPSFGTANFVAWLNDPRDESGMPITLPVHDIVLTSTRDSHGKAGGHGLGDLVAQTLALSPEDEKDAFRIAQRLNLPWKREMARPVIAQAAAAAAGAAAVPLPIADAVTLAPIQLAMMARIATIYDLELKTMLSAATLAQLGAQLTGQALARSFLKLIPGVGSVLTASVAAAVTAAVGEGWMRLCEQVHTGKVKAGQVENAWRTFAPSIVDVVAQIFKNRGK